MAVKTDAKGIGKSISKGVKQFAMTGVESVGEFVHPCAFDHVALGLMFVGDGADGALCGFDVLGVEGGEGLHDFE